MRRIFTLGAALAMFVGSAALADEVVFKNGDKITGKILDVDPKSIVVDSDLAGQVKIDTTAVRTMSSVEPVRVKLADGSMKSERLSAGADGMVKVGADQVPLNMIGKITGRPVAWTGDITLGAAFTRGNSFTDAVNLGVNAQRRTDADRTTLLGGFIYGRQKEAGATQAVTTAENWFAEGKYDWFYNDKLYFFGDLRLEQDRIANLAWRIVPSAGAGYQFIDTDDLAFSAEAGLAYLYESYNNVIPPAEEDSGSVSLRLGYHLTGNFNAKVSYFHNLSFFPSLEDTSDFLVYADAGVRAKLTKSMFGQAKMIVNYDSTPAAGSLKFDMKYLLSLGWSF